MISFANSYNSIKNLPFHPYVIAVFSITSLYASNFPDIPLADVVLPLVVVLMGAVVTVFVMRLMFASKERAAIAGSYVLFLTLFFTHFCVILEFLLSHWIRYIRYRYSLSGWLVLIIVGLVWLRLSKQNDRKMTILLNFVSILLVISSVSTIGFKFISSLSEFQLKGQMNTINAEKGITLQRPKKARDIYYLVFDRYPNNQFLENEYGFNNTPFYNHLQERGFFIATNSWTNYPRTVISMASALNMAYHSEVILSDTVYGKMIKNHKVGRFLKTQGYKYFHVGNFYNPLRFNKNADFNHRISIFPSEFADIVYSMTPISRVWPFGAPTYILSRLGIDDKGGYSSLTQMNVLKKITSMEGPKFVYVHFLPYHTNAIGKSFIERTTFINDSIVEMIDDILSKTKIPPIIVIQADEGPYLSNKDRNLDRIMQIRKRTGIISAFYLPGENVSGTIPSTISPVNTFRLIFKEYFDADIDLLDDRIFYWEKDSIQQLGTPGPGKFVDVTDTVRRIKTSRND